MDAEDVPFFAALIFPGFFAIQTFIWSAGGIKLSDVMRVTWSFVVSVPVFFGAHAFFRLVEVWEPCLPNAAENAATCLPSPEVIAGSSADTPAWFLASLYLGGAILGYVTGVVWRTRQLDRVLLSIGLDVRRHRPALNQALNQESHIDVKLIDGTLYRGYPRMFSDGDESVQVIYLTDALRRDAGAWKEQSRPVVIPLDRVERIYILNPARPLFPSVTLSTAGTFSRLRSALRQRLDKIVGA